MNLVIAPKNSLSAKAKINANLGEKWNPEVGGACLGKRKRDAMVGGKPAELGWCQRDDFDDTRSAHKKKLNWSRLKLKKFSECKKEKKLL